MRSAADGPWPGAGRSYGAQDAECYGQRFLLALAVTVRHRIAAASPALKFVVIVAIMSLFAYRRASGYGLFTGVYGIAWVAGSIVIGALFNVSLIAVVVFSMAAVFAGIPLILMVGGGQRRERAAGLPRQPSRTR